MRSLGSVWAPGHCYENTRRQPYNCNATPHSTVTTVSSNMTILMYKHGLVFIVRMFRHGDRLIRTAIPLQLYREPASLRGESPSRTKGGELVTATNLTIKVPCCRTTETDKEVLLFPDRPYGTHCWRLCMTHHRH